MASSAEKIAAGLGGIDNIVEVKGYGSRLNVEVRDGSLLNEAALVAGGAQLIAKWRTSIRVILDEADPIAAEIADLMRR